MSGYIDNVQDYAPTLSKGLLAATMAASSLAGPASGAVSSVYVVRAGYAEIPGTYMADNSSGGKLRVSDHDVLGLYLNSGAQEKASILESSVDLLRDVHEGLIPNVKSLAHVMGVSRQMIYRWRAGGSLSNDKWDRLQVLARCSQEWRRMSGKRMGPLFRRKVYSNLSLMDILSAPEIREDDANKAMRVISRVLESKAERAVKVRQRGAAVLGSDQIVSAHSSGSARI